MAQAALLKKGDQIYAEAGLFHKKYKICEIVDEDISKIQIGKYFFIKPYDMRIVVLDVVYSRRHWWQFWKRKSVKGYILGGVM